MNISSVSEIMKSSFSVNKNLSDSNKKTSNNKLESNKLNQKDGNNIASKIVITKKGQAGYMPQMDLDDDGQISLEEFNKYCEENGISEKEKVALLTAMNYGKRDEKVTEESEEASKEINGEEGKDTENDEENEMNVYARKGDEKYNEKMDENENGIVTYAEYMKYLNDRGEKTEESDLDYQVEFVSSSEINSNETESSTKFENTSEVEFEA